MGVLFALSIFNFQFSIAPVQAQKIPVEEDILPKILDTESPFYYPALMARYMEGDETLTGDDYYYLYYGFAYDNNYDAHKELPGASVMYGVFKRSSRPTREEALSIIEAGRLNMTVDPFSPSNVNMMTWAYGLVGDTLQMARSAARFRGIVGAIESSGTGLRERSPWHILRFTHANDIVAERGLKIANRQVRSRTVEYIQVEPNPAKVKGYFFNYERVYWNPYDGERIQKKSNWQFNGIPL